MRNLIRLLILYTGAARVAHPPNRLDKVSGIWGSARDLNFFCERSTENLRWSSKVGVENPPPSETEKSLDYYHPVCCWEVLISGQYIFPHRIFTYRGDEQRTSPAHIYGNRPPRKAVDHDSGPAKKIGGDSRVSISVSGYRNTPHYSSLPV